jgi:hypothetical protein
MQYLQKSGGGGNRTIRRSRDSNPLLNLLLLIYLLCFLLLTHSLRSGRSSTPVESKHSALFPSPWGGVPPGGFSPASLFSLFAPRVFANSLAITWIRSLSKKCRVYGVDSKPANLRTFKPSDPAAIPPPVQKRTVCCSLPSVYSPCAILPSLRPGDRPLLLRWRSS